MPVESCPLCCRLFARLGQHLKVFHNVKNIEERKLLLSLESGRVNIRHGRCPVPGCGKDTSRLDRHIKSHCEISEAARDEYMMYSKRVKVLDKLSALRASQPEVPMISTLDLEAAEHPWADQDAVPVFETDEEDKDCGNSSCKSRVARMRAQISDLNQQIDTLSNALKNVTRRYRVLKRRTSTKGAARVQNVTKKLLSSLGPEEESGAPDEPTPPSTHEEPSGTQPPSDIQPSSVPEASSGQTSSPPHYPNHVAVLNDLLEEYRRHQEGPDPTYKMRENVSGKIYRIRKFLGYMSEGKTNLANLCFLNETSKIYKWISVLRQSYMKETTVKHYAQNVAQFFDYIAETPPSSCRLSRTVLIGLRREMRRVLKSLGRGVSIHQVAVKAMKEDRVLSKATLLKCQELSSKAIPELLASLERDPSYKNLWRFYGHFSAFLASLYGHRGGVLTNMTIQEVQGARYSRNEKAHVINVCSHKTNKAFGPAQIALLDNEYAWARQFLAMKDKLPGGEDAKFFFFTSKPNPCKNLNGYFQEAWKEMGLPGCPTFTDIRTSIASHAKFTHATDDREKLAKFMCHDVRTADKFYVTNLSVKQAVEHRMLFQAALQGEEQSPPEKAHKPQKRKRPMKRTPQPRKRSARDSDVTSSSTSSDDAVPEGSDKQGEEQSPPETAHTHQKRKRPMKRTPQPRKRSARDSDLTSSSTSPDDAVPEGSDKQGEEQSPPETAHTHQKRKRPMKRTPQPRKRSARDSDVTSSSTSSDDAVPEGSDEDERQESGEMAAEVTEKTKQLKVVLTPLGLKARLRPRRISPLQLRKVIALQKSKAAAKKVQESMEKRRRKK